MSVAQAKPSISVRKLGGLEIGFVGYDGLKASPDGQFLAMLSTPGEKGSDCYVFERRTHKTMRVPGSFRLEPLTFSRSGKAIWVWGLQRDEVVAGLEKISGEASFIGLYDLRRHRFLRAFSDKADGWDVPAASALSRDGRTLIVAWRDGTARGFGTRSGKLKWKRQISDESEGPAFFSLSSDGSRLIQSSDGGNEVSGHVISTRTGRVLRTLRLKLATGMRSAFGSGRLAPRGRMAAVFQPDTQQWVFFDTGTGRIHWKFGHPSQTSEGDFAWKWSPDARRVAVSGPGEIQLRDAYNGSVLDRVNSYRSGLIDSGGPLAFSPNGKKLYVLTDSDTGFGASSVMWQLRLQGTACQRRADASWMTKTRAAERRFAISPRHRDQSLIIAARGGDDKRVAFLLDHGANIETRHGGDESPLSLAIFSNDVYPGPHRYRETTALLLARGADITRDAGLLLAGAAAKGDDALVRELFRRGANPNSSAREYGTSTALVAAIKFGRISTVKLLLDHGASPNSRNEKEAGPLWEMADTTFDGDEEATIARLLLDKGANVNARTPLKSELAVGGQTALISAAWHTKRSLLAMLLKRGADPNIADTQGCTALMRIAMWDEAMDDMPDAERLSTQLKMVEVLLAHGARLDLRDQRGRTAFDLASSPKLRAAFRFPGASAKNPA